MACLNGMYEAHKKLKEGTHGPLGHPDHRQEWDGAWSGMSHDDSAGLELIFFTLQQQPAWDKLCKLDKG